MDLSKSKNVDSSEKGIINEGILIVDNNQGELKLL